MKFRIVRYYDRFTTQVWKDTYGWVDIGSPNGYHSVDAAKQYCQKYKAEQEDYIVEQFEI